MNLFEFVCDDSLHVVETPKASIKYHKPVLLDNLSRNSYVYSDKTRVASFLIGLKNIPQKRVSWESVACVADANYRRLLASAK